MNLRRLGFRKACRITCVVNAELASDVTAAARRLGVGSMLVQSARSAVLRERRFLAALRGSTRLEEDLVQVYRLHVPPAAEARVIGEIVRAARLATPGRGTVYSEPVELYGADGLAAERGAPRGEVGARDGGGARLARKLALICCIVPRGEANGLARALLEMGLSVPTVSYGVGMGLRNKLGLLRITIPVDKEVIELVVDHDDAREVFSYLTDAARLRYPGKGFMYMSPLRLCLPNTAIYRGEVRHVASMEQVIAAIDTLARDTGWRRKSFAGPGERRERRFLSGMMSYTITCNEGDLEDLVRAAMAAGAGGATMRRLRFANPAAEPVPERERSSGAVAATGAAAGGGPDRVLGARTRESSDLVIAADLVAQVHQAVLGVCGGTLREGQILEVSTVEAAVSYVHR